eukprot:CAMPEP_0182551408 /NCGR_PEP_ID=MMETSP1323-20130603/44839_1 /TAXON_ID=236787 /ORGANISM="Florenciella parvula, Strain RCC1693" /LENGTH=142 /DNA_ID=CAMNT_0024763015 /DNA_START=14 /DNA_END=439 /DNA_ORIENTATION=-
MTMTVLTATCTTAVMTTVMLPRTIFAGNGCVHFVRLHNLFGVFQFVIKNNLLFLLGEEQSLQFRHLLVLRLDGGHLHDGHEAPDSFVNLVIILPPQDLLLELTVDDHPTEYRLKPNVQDRDENEEVEEEWSQPNLDEKKVGS